MSDFDFKSGGEDDSEAWLVSYADMMTLIACFFILMMAFANFEPKKFSNRASAVSESFTGKDPGEKSENQANQLKEAIESNPALTGKVETKISDNGLELTFSSATLFSSGSAEISPEGFAPLTLMVDMIKKQNPDFRIVVEGHTDDQPVKKGSGIKNNWSLSSSRAGSVIDVFESEGFKSRQLVAVGYADTRSLLPNKNKKGEPIPENMQKNRRVVIKVLEPLSGKNKKKMGLGVYFDSDEADI
jgi:chemotaxis protein MotB